MDGYGGFTGKESILAYILIYRSGVASSHHGNKCSQEVIFFGTVLTNKLHVAASRGCNMQADSCSWHTRGQFKLLNVNLQELFEVGKFGWTWEGVEFDIWLMWTPKEVERVSAK